MPKYVCDFETVRTIGKNLVGTAGEIKSYLTEYITKIKSDTAGWQSDAKTSFEGVNQVYTATTSGDVEYAVQIGEFIQYAADTIEETDSSISIKI